MPGDQRKRLPWTYYPIFGVGLVFIMVLAAGACILIGTNPYVGASVAGPAWVLHETYLLKRKGY
jgi:hypothetical protein